MSSSENPRFHIAKLDASQGPLEFSTSEAHHAMHVLRLGVGAEVELFDGMGRRANAKIVQARHGKVSVELGGPVSAESRPSPAIHLAFAVPKGKRLDWLLEKVTELGAASLRPVVFERSISGGGELGETKQERWLAHCIAAAKQCWLNFLPEIRESLTLKEFLAGKGADSSPPQTVRLVGDLGDSAASLPQALADWQVCQPVHVLVGPEGGFTEAERQAIREGGFAAVRLGATTLRIETAAMALLVGVLAQR